MEQAHRHRHSHRYDSMSLPPCPGSSSSSSSGAFLCHKIPIVHSTPAQACLLKTNEMACYQKLYATVDSHSFNGKPRRYKNKDGSGHSTPYCQEQLPVNEFKCERVDDPRILPYGLPPDTYDVKRRKDWLSTFTEEYYRIY